MSYLQLFGLIPSGQCLESSDIGRYYDFWTHPGALTGAPSAGLLTWWLTWRQSPLLASQHPTLRPCPPLLLPSGQHGTRGSASHLHNAYNLSHGLSALTLGMLDMVGTSHCGTLRASLGMCSGRSGYEEAVSVWHVQSRLRTGRDSAQAGLGALQVVRLVAAVAQQQHVALVRLIAHAAPATDRSA